VPESDISEWETGTAALDGGSFEGQHADSEDGGRVGWARRTRLWCSWIVVTGMSTALMVQASAAPAWTLENIVERTPLESPQLDELRAGQVITTPIVEAGPRELAMALACLAYSSSADLLQPFLGDRPIVPSEYLTQSGRIQTETDWNELDRSTLSLRHAGELARYLDATPGFTLNLSREEHAEFGGISGEKESNHVGAVRHAIHRMLADRYRGYRESGLPGIAVYLRGEGETVSPGDLLEDSLGAATGLATLFPRFQSAWRDYPKTGFEARDDTFFWASLEVDDRPAWLLAHRYAGPQVVGQRTFYVSHFFDAGTTVAGWVDVPEGRVFFLTTRLWIDRLSGFGASLKRRLGERLLATQMKETIARAGICEVAP
jgi:hypothetical protein